jgi:hypothetical protein
MGFALVYPSLYATPPCVIKLYSYPELFGVADNNGYGLKGVRLPAADFSDA